jgi:hypothetical protein
MRGNKFRRHSSYILGRLLILCIEKGILLKYKNYIPNYKIVQTFLRIMHNAHPRLHQ